MGKVQYKCLESICLYGQTGVGKTSQIAYLSDAIRELYGDDALVRLVSANADGWGVIQPYVDMGRVVPTWVPGRTSLVETFQRLCRGWWPADPDDPDSPLLPIDQQKGRELVKATVFDSGTDIAEYSMNYGLDQEAQSNGKVRMAQSDAAHIFKDGETRFATPALAHYGADQTWIKNFILFSKNIPGQFVMWTFLEDKGKNEQKTAFIYGPDVIGSALTSTVPSWFGRVLRLSTHDTTKGLVRRLWLHRHYQQGDPIPYVANARDFAGAPLPDYLENENANLHTFYKLLAESHRKAKESMSTTNKGGKE